MNVKTKLVAQTPDMAKDFQQILDITPLSYKKNRSLKRALIKQGYDVQKEAKEQNAFKIHLSKHMIDSETNLPELLVLLVVVFLSSQDEMTKGNHIEMIKVKGIFRIPAGKNQLQALTNAITQGDYEYVYNIRDAKLIAGGIKLFFQEAKSPLFTYACYEMLKDYKRKAFSLIISSLQVERPAEDSLDQGPREASRAESPGCGVSSEFYAGSDQAPGG